MYGADKRAAFAELSVANVIDVQIILHWQESQRLVSYFLCPLRRFRSCIGCDVPPWQPGRRCRRRERRYSRGPSLCWSSRPEVEATKSTLSNDML